MSKLHDWRRIKKRHAYTARELAHLLDLAESTVYRWLKRGLPQLGSGRPALVLGSAAIEFIRALRKSCKRPCGCRELHCLRCKTARAVANNVAEMIPISQTRAYLKGNCSECGCKMYQIVRIEDIPTRMPGVSVHTKVAKEGNV